MRDDLAIILRYIKENGKQVNLHTNGLRLSDEKYLEGLLPYIDLLVFPIHSSDYGVFDSITQVPDSAKKAFEVFEKLVRIEHLAITSQTVINQLNYRTLPETFDRIQSISPGNKMMLTFPTPSGAAQSVKVTPRYSEIKDYIQPVLRKYGPLLDSRDIPRCYLYPYQNLTRNCDDNHCIVEKDKENENRRIKAPGCKNCIFDKKCVGVWREYGILYPDLDLFPVF